MTADPEERTCPLCRCPHGEDFFQDKRTYYRCSVCSLVFVPSGHFLSLEEEKAVYDLHENDPEDPGYRQFLSRLYTPVCDRLVAPAQGLDFGSGPGPTLSVMFEEAGHAVKIYDPLYANDPSVFQNQYDFITASEVVEHMREPRAEFQRLWSCLKPGGWLGVMTKRVIDRKAFATWHYKEDLSHIRFYSEATFQWLARELGADVEFIGNDVVLFRKTV